MRGSYVLFLEGRVNVTHLKESPIRLHADGKDKWGNDGRCGGRERQVIGRQDNGQVRSRDF